jgi:CRISPR/Cas system-associated exonuclease Cas4 (RecB family)
MTGTGATNPPDEAARVKMAMGNGIHKIIQDILHGSDKVKVIESEKCKEAELNGLQFIYYVDAIIEIDNKKYIVEIKSTYASGWNSIEKDPKSDHVDQLMAYMELEKVDRGILIYIGRDNGYMVEYAFAKTKEIQKRLLDRLDKLKKLRDDIRDSRIPDRDYSMVFKRVGAGLSESFTKDKKKYKSDWQCRYCQYKDKCWSDVVDQMKEYSFYINRGFIV